MGPSIEFVDDVIEHFASHLEAGESDDDVAEAWTPFLISTSAASDDTSAREVCQRILRQLRTPAEESEETIIQELSEYLQQLKLTKYLSKAEAWCREKKAKDLSVVRANWEDFSSYLGLLRLEIKRVKEDADKSMESQDDDKPVLVGDRLRQEKLRKALMNGRETFGNPPYTVMEKLGFGATAEVCRCVRIEHGSELKEYAVKIVSLKQFKMLPNFRDHINRLKQEITILFTLQHPNIVQLTMWWMKQARMPATTATIIVNTTSYF